MYSVFYSLVLVVKGSKGTHEGFHFYAACTTISYWPLLDSTSPRIKVFCAGVTDNIEWTPGSLLPHPLQFYVSFSFVIVQECLFCSHLDFRMLALSRP